MARHTEIELKLVCTDSSMWEKIMTAQSLIAVAVSEGVGRQVLDARYFDTDTHCLQKAKLAYRIRREGEQWVATIKDSGRSRGGLHERQEWNVVVSDDQPNISVFEGADIGKHLIGVVGNQKLETIVMTKFERRTLDVIMLDGSRIEVAADQGTIIAGSKNIPILEVELELKSGKPSALFQLGAALAREYPLLLETDSKFFRGLKLAGLAKAQPNQVGKVQIDKKEPAGEGIQSILVHLIAEVLVAQQDFLAIPTQPEQLHKLRISLRRLRSVLEFYAPLMNEEQYKYHQAELRKLGQMLAKVREIDVADAAWQQCSHCQPTSTESKASLGVVLAKYRRFEVEKIHKTLYAGFATPLLLDLWAMLTENKGQQPIEQHCSLGDYSVSRLSSWIKTLTKQGKIVDWASVGNIYKLRLQIKKIMYVAEVLEPVFYDISPLILRLDILQQKLGLLSDADSTEELLMKLLKPKSSKALHLEVGMVLGWQGREIRVVQGKMDKHWKKLYRSAQRWL